MDNTGIHESYLKHIINGRNEKSFGINKNFMTDFKKEIINMYSSTNNKKLLYPEHIHDLLLKFFTNVYYPDISKNLHIDNNNAAVIMGGIAFNKNIPVKLNKFLTMETTDIDLKIYTTDITPFNKNQTHKYQKTLSLFKFVSLITPIFLKQILTYIMNIEDTIFESHSNSTNNSTIKRTTKLTIKELSKSSSKTKKTIKQLGGFNN